MTIEIKDSDQTIELSDDQLDNDNFIDIHMEEEGKTMTLTVPIDDLFAALIAFDSKRSRRISREHPENE